jgi:hypothetical protein
MHRNGHFAFFFVAPAVKDTTAIIDFAQFGGRFGGETGSLQRLFFLHHHEREDRHFESIRLIIFSCILHRSSAIYSENLEKN